MSLAGRIEGRGSNGRSSPFDDVESQRNTDPKYKDLDKAVFALEQREPLNLLGRVTLCECENDESLAVIPENCCQYSAFDPWVAELKVVSKQVKDYCKTEFNEIKEKTDETSQKKRKGLLSLTNRISKLNNKVCVARLKKIGLVTVAVLSFFVLYYFSNQLRNYVGSE